jgi:C-terminal processing protease CtpA/Prc
VPITFADDIPLVPARLNGKAGDFALDSGNGASLVVQHVWAEKNGLAEEMKRGVAMMSFGSGGASKNWASRIADFEVGGSTFHRVIARYVEDKEGSVSSRTEAGNIGTEVLANFTLDFDYAHNVIWFKSVSGFTPSPFSRSGMSLYRDSPGSLVVVNTAPGGPADLAGIRAGDAIVSIADKSATAMMSRELMQTFTQAAGTKVPIVYRRKGQQENATIELKELLP